MAKTKAADAGSSETADVDFSYISVNVGGQTHTVPWPSAAAKAAGIVPCANGHPNTPDPTTGAISCGCGSTEVAS